MIMVMMSSLFPLRCLLPLLTMSRDQIWMSPWGVSPRWAKTVSVRLSLSLFFSCHRRFLQWVLFKVELLKCTFTPLANTNSCSWENPDVSLLRQIDIVSTFRTQRCHWVTIVQSPTSTMITRITALSGPFSTGGEMSQQSCHTSCHTSCYSCQQSF